MSLSLGRVNGLPEPTSWVQTGNAVAIIGSYRSSGIGDGLVKRDQLRGLLDNADDPIPVVMDNEPRVTGYYRVKGVSVTTDEFARLKGNLYDYRVDLEEVKGVTQPMMESVLSGALLTNAVAAVIGDVHAFHAVPAAASEYAYKGVSSVFNARLSADGNLIFLDSGQVLTSTARFGLAPANFYIGSAVFEQGSPLRPVVGDSVQPDLINWRLSNALVRVTPNATPGKLDVSHFNGSTWSPVKTYALSASLPVTAIPDRDAETITTTGGSPFGLGVQASFKATGAIARVGALGAFTTGTAGSVSPAFGQATTAGHLLTAAVDSGSAAITTGAAGWVQAVTQSFIGQVSIWYKPNCGAGEAAPTFTCSGGGAAMHAQLAEYSGVATVSPLDQTGQAMAWGTSVPISSAAADAGLDLVVTAIHWDLTSAATATFTSSYSTAPVVAAGNSGAANVTGHGNYAYGIIAAVPLTLTGWNSLAVLRNDPEEVVIRLSLATSQGNVAGILTLDLSLRRGDRLVRLYVTSSNLSYVFKLARDTPEAATAIAYSGVTLGGIRATADDGAGNRYVLLSYQAAAPVNDLANGAITQGGGALVADYAIGAEVGGSHASPGLDDAVSLARQYLAAQVEEQRVVVR